MRKAFEIIPNSVRAYGGDIFAARLAQDSDSERKINLRRKAPTVAVGSQLPQLFIALFFLLSPSAALGPALLAIGGRSHSAPARVIEELEKLPDAVRLLL